MLKRACAIFGFVSEYKYAGTYYCMLLIQSICKPRKDSPGGT